MSPLYFTISVNGLNNTLEQYGLILTIILNLLLSFLSLTYKSYKSSLVSTPSSGNNFLLPDNEMFKDIFSFLDDLFKLSLKIIFSVESIFN